MSKLKEIRDILYSTNANLIMRVLQPYSAQPPIVMRKIEKSELATISLKKFFENFYDETGIPVVDVDFRRKNGSTDFGYPKGNPKIVRLNFSKSGAKGEQKESKSTAMEHQTTNNSFSGLNGLNAGLQMYFDRIKTDAEEYKRSYEKESDTVKRLTEELNEAKRKYDLLELQSKMSENSFMNKIDLNSFMPIISKLIDKTAGGKLNGAASQNQNTQEKGTKRSDIIELVSLNTVPDSIIDRIHYVISKYAINDEQFITQLEKIIKENEQRNTNTSTDGEYQN